MEMQDMKSPETIEFIKTLDKLKELITNTLSQRTPKLNGEKYLTNNDLVRLLHISLRSLQEYRDTGKIPYIRISGKILYKESDIIKLLEANYYDFTGNY